MLSALFIYSKVYSEGSSQLKYELCVDKSFGIFSVLSVFIVNIPDFVVQFHCLAPSVLCRYVTLNLNTAFEAESCSFL